MAADMALLPRARPFAPNAISTTHRDITDDRYRDLRRPRKVRFFANGDRYFKGKRLHITPHRYVTFNDLLNDLTGKLPGSIQLPYGVRQIFTPVTGRRVRTLEDLQDGAQYVCGGFEPFRSIAYGKEKLEPWCHRKAPDHELHDGPGDLNASTGYGRAYYGAFQPSRTLRHSYPARKQFGTFGTRGGQGSYWGAPGVNDPSNYHKPKVITVIRNGTDPRSDVKILLNRRSIQSYEHLVKDISEAFGPKWRNNKVRKLFTVRGKEVQGVSDFFRDDDVFIGLGSEALTMGDVRDILSDLYPDSAHPGNLLKEWQKTKRRLQAPSYAYKVKDVEEDAKRDSGLGSDSSREEPKGSSDRDDVIYQGLPAADLPRAKRLKRPHYAQERDAPPPDPDVQDDDAATRIERERMRAAEGERERARRRMQKRLDSERLALDEERRKRGLLPLKPISDTPRRSRDPSKESPERRRVRMRQLSPSPEVTRRAKPKHVRSDSDNEPKVIVVVKDDVDARSRGPSPVRYRNVAGSEDQGKEAGRHKTRGHNGQRNDRVSGHIDSGDHGDDEHGATLQGRKSVGGRAAQSESRGKEGNERGGGGEDTSSERQGDRGVEGKEDPRGKGKESKEKGTGKDKENVVPKDKSSRRKSKSKAMVHKTKLERQISSQDHVLSRYEPGKILGDGNFAVVKQAKGKHTPGEYAMKIIDKAKLKGKEQMIENEIAIMKVCSHPNIVRLYEEFESPTEIYLLMELVKGGDLFDAITQSVKFDEPTSAGMVSDLASALFYLHSRHVVHRDLKPENLLVCRNKDGGLSLKLADFGLAMEVTEDIYTVCGTPTYVAPEILAEVGYGLEVDMWAVGVISYILLCGFPPFRSPDRKQTELFEFIKAGEFEFLAPYWDNISKAAKNLIERLLVVDRSKRATAVHVLCHPWVITKGGTAAPPGDSLDDYRQQLQRDLETQARANRDSFTNSSKRG